MESPPIPPSATADIESLFPREGAPSKLGAKKEFGDKLKTSARELDNEFSSTSNLLVGMCKAHAPKGTIALRAIEAISLRAKAAAATRGMIKHVAGIIRFPLYIRDETKVGLDGGKSVVLLRDCLERLAGRGRTIPATAKHALSVWAEALCIDWPLSHTLV